MTGTSGQRLAEFFSNIEACTDKNLFTHGLHPYPAKFIPHIPRELIRAYAPEAAPVLDPMCGSGTAVLEAALTGRSAIGSDVNPVATLVSAAKSTVLDDAGLQRLETLACRFAEDAARIERDPALAEKWVPDGELPEFRNRRHWFTDAVARELKYAQRIIEAIPDSTERRLALCSLSAIVVVVSNQESETRWCAKPKEVIPGAALERLAVRLAKSVASVRQMAVLGSKLGPVQIHCADARVLPVKDRTIGMVVTSPPYANAHDYYLYNKLRLFWLGFDVRSIQGAEFGSRNKHSDLKYGIEAYLEAMGLVIAECYRVIQPGGVLALVVGDSVIRGCLYDARELLTPVAAWLGFRPIDHYSFSHTRFNKTFQQGFGTHRRKATHVLVWERP